MLPAQQLEHRRQRLARLQEERDQQLSRPEPVPATSPTPHRSDPASSPPAQAPVAQSSSSDAPTSRATPRRTVSSLPGEKTCWICYETSTESPSRPFVHACSCTLLSHSDCLLEWISTRVATSSSAGASASRPKCPVCATPILVEERQFPFLTTYRKFVRQLHQLSIVATVGGVAASGWFVASAYGMWALRVFMGDQVARALLERESTKRIPFKLWFNLPMIPFALILSRTPLIDSLLPFLPLTLALSTHSTTPSRHPHPFLSLAPLFPNPDPLGLADLSLKFPPSPTLTICLIPWMRIAYFRLRAKLFRRVLGHQKMFRGLAGMMEEAAREEQNTWEVLARDPNNVTATRNERGEGPATNEGRGRMRNGIELVAELEYEYVEEGGEEEEEDEEDAAAAERENVAAAQGGVASATAEREQRREERQRRRRQRRQEAAVEAAAEPDPPSSLRIGIGRLTSLLLGALVYPALSSLAGSVLFYLATRGSRTNPSLPIKTLRKILGISTLIASSSSSTSLARSSSSSLSSALSFLNPFASLLPTTSLANPSIGGVANAASGVVDPVWIRNTIGGGLVLVARDAVDLTIGILEKRRKESRKIVERPVGEGLSLRQEE
ncbi:hypothetical protein JCM3766R1_000603 [Sporobolomyces carnicolor]